MWGVTVGKGPNKNGSITSQATRGNALHPIACAHFLCMQNGFTALMLAAINEHRDMVELLLGHGAQIEHQTKVIRGDG